jgi:hypothetical protein
LGGPQLEGPRGRAKGAGADFLLAVALIVLFAVAAYLSIQMDRPRGWLSAPGLLPLLLSISLIGMFSVIAARAVGRGALDEIGRRERPGELSQWFREERVRRVTLAAGIIALYYFLLLRFLPFELATSAFFLIAFAFFWPTASRTRRIVISVALTAAFTAGFRGFFNIILPGEGDLLGSALYWFAN